MKRKHLAVVATAAAVALAPLTTAGAVVNGTPAQDGQFPFMASLQDGSGFAFCGGSVVSSGWVLTAAHCVPDGNADDLYVVTGKTDLGKAGGQRIKVSSVSVNPAYDGSAHDTALLRLSEPTTATPIALSGTGDDDLEAPGAPVRVAGWGDTLPTMGLFSSNQLQYADLEVVSDADCGQTNFGFDGASGVCAATLLKDSCQGDSGGPLFATKSGRVVQVGVVSYGTSCAVPEFPGVYSEVNNPQIREWIRSVSGV